MTKNNITNEVCDLKEQGLSFSQIGEKLGISKTSAHRIFMQNTENNSENESFTDETEANYKTDKDLNTNTNPKLIYHLKRLELNHEKDMKEMEFDELERQRLFQKEQMDYQNQISKLKFELEQMKRSQDVQLSQNQINTNIVPAEIEDDETEVETEIIVPKKIRDAFGTFIENVFEFNNTEIDKETAKQLLEQNIFVQKYFAKWIKVKEIDPGEVPHRVILKKLQKILQIINEYFENRGFFSSSYTSYEIPDDLFNEISELV